eukprot:scaffold18528_cov27-Tisochrysis_lutea.AAC.1
MFPTQVDCSLLGQLQGPEKEPPRLQLLFLEETPSNNETIRQLPYGWEDGILIVRSVTAEQSPRSVASRRQLLQEGEVDLASLNGRELNLAYGFKA